MRDVCNNKSGGRVVAAVVAVLEKQQTLNGNRSFSSTSGKCSSNFFNNKNLKGNFEQTNNRNQTDNKEFDNNSTDEIFDDFQSAVKDFDIIAEDVEKIVAKTNSIKLLQQQKEINTTDELVEKTDFLFLYDANERNYSNREKQKSYIEENKDENVERKVKNEEEEEDENKTDIDCIVLGSKYLNYHENSIQTPSTSNVNSITVDLEISSSDDSSNSSDTDSEKEHVINEGLPTIDEEERGNTSSSCGVHSYQGLEEEDDDEDDDDNDSSPEEDESTIKDKNIIDWSGNLSNHDSTSDLSTTSSERVQSLRDSSTRCNDDFQWIRKDLSKSPPSKIISSNSSLVSSSSLPPATPISTTTTSITTMDDNISTTAVVNSNSKPPINRSSTTITKISRREKTAPGSLDRRRTNSNRLEREQKSRSIHLTKSPPRLDDFTPCQNWCCNPNDNFCLDNFHRHHERIDPQRYGSSPMLMEHQQQQHHHHQQQQQSRFNEQRGSHPDIYSDCNRYRHDQMYNYCSCHMLPPPPPCYYYGDRGYHWTPSSFYTKPNEQDEKFRKLQYEKDNLQLQVQVLNEQIQAQGDKISDLEAMLCDKKQQLAEAEDKLQREVLSRSSLETQKLELMSIMSELKLQHAALERENLDLRNCQYNNNGEIKKPPHIPRLSTQTQITSTPIHHSSNQGLNTRMSPSPSPVTLAGNSPRRIETPTIGQDVQPPKTPPANYKGQIDIHYGSLPRQQFINNGTTITAVDSNANPANNTSKKGVAFGRGLSSLIGVRSRGYSVPNLAETEKIVIDDNNSTDSQQSPTIQFNKNKGIKKIFGRMKRSGSGNLEELPGINEFQRGGVRATASARLGWSEPQLIIKPDKPFAEWDTENICDWLQDLGLDQYINDAKRWIKNGEQLQETSIVEIEKELNIKNPLHKKKLQLALIDTQENGSSDLYLKKAGQLDTAWVLRWLDDTGLPQHKENFLINRVDGRVLHRLTIDDLALLHITSMLHVASIKRGIQVLRENDYEPNCLQRRSLADEPTQPTPKQISLWTTHRVMEWLRAVDLAEYAPNLRGAGVHGGLMVYETKFTAELLATLLSIPPGKTLLRRHLNTHFKELLGKDIIQEKREAEATMGYIPLTPSSKLKIAKKSQFSLKRKKSKGEADYGDLVCPLNPDKQSGEMNGSALNNSMGMMKMENRKVEDASHHVEYKIVNSSPASIANSPIPQRHV